MFAPSAKRSTTFCSKGPAKAGHYRNARETFCSKGQAKAGHYRNARDQMSVVSGFKPDLTAHIITANANEGSCV